MCGFEPATRRQMKSNTQTGGDQHFAGEEEKKRKVPATRIMSRNASLNKGKSTILKEQEQRSQREVREKQHRGSSFCGVSLQIPRRLGCCFSNSMAPGNGSRSSSYQQSRRNAQRRKTYINPDSPLATDSCFRRFMLFFLPWYTKGASEILFIVS